MVEIVSEALLSTFVLPHTIASNWSLKGSISVQENNQKLEFSTLNGFMRTLASGEVDFHIPVKGAIRIGPGSPTYNYPSYLYVGNTSLIWNEFPDAVNYYPGRAIDVAWEPQENKGFSTQYLASIRSFIRKPTTLFHFNLDSTVLIRPSSPITLSSVVATTSVVFLEKPSTVTSAVGLWTEVDCADGTTIGTGTGLYCSLGGASSATQGEITTGYAIRLSGFAKTYYGIYFDSITGGTSLTYTLYQPNDYAIFYHAGKVGIGEGAPYTRLHVVETSSGARTSALTLQNSAIATNTAVSLDFIAYNSNTVTGRIDHIYNGTNYDLVFSTFGSSLSEKMRIKGDGKVGIGCSPNYTLDVNGNINGAANGYLRFGSGDIEITDSNCAILFKTYSGSLAERVRIAADGKVGIGVTPSYLLHLNTDSAGKPTTNTWTITSDAKTKKNVRPYTDGLAKILLINPVLYQYNGEAGTPLDEEGVGVIAQDVQTVLPRMVKAQKAYKEKLDEEGKVIKDEKGVIAFEEYDTDILGFNSHELTYLLINAVKELKAEIDTIKVKIK